MPIVDIIVNYETSFKAGEEAVVKLELRCVNKLHLQFAHTPRFSKKKEVIKIK